MSDVLHVLTGFIYYRNARHCVMSEGGDHFLIHVRARVHSYLGPVGALFMALVLIHNSTHHCDDRHTSYTVEKELTM